MQKIIWADRVRNEEVLQRDKKGRNILRTVKRRRVNKIGHILRRNCLVNYFDVFLTVHHSIDFFKLPT